MRVAIIGSGYVGTIVGACLAKLGNEIVLVDPVEEKVQAINDRQSLIREEGLDELIKQVDVEATTDYQRALDSELIFICVGTLPDEHSSTNLEHVEEAAEQIAEVLMSKEEYCVICLKSTAPPGTTEQVVIPTLARSGKRIGSDYGVCVNPEFLREGKAIDDFMNPARIIVGEHDKRSGDALLSLYTNFKVPVLRTNPRTAEMIKLVSNSFLATKISFINEIGNICKKLDIDVYEVAKGMGLDDRIGHAFLNAGIGFGGSCLPKDLRMLIERAKEVGYEPRILEEVSNLNERQALQLVELLKKHISLQGSTVGLLGLAFKPGTDDVRDSRAAIIVEALLQEGAVVKAYDPMAAQNFERLFPQIAYVTKEEALNSDAILIITEWEEFNELDYEAKAKIVIDGRMIPRAKGAMIYEGVCW